MILSKKKDKLFLVKYRQTLPKVVIAFLCLPVEV